MKKFSTTLLFLSLLAPIWGQSTVTIKDGDLLGGQTFTWTRSNIYLLDGFVYLEEGGVLNIEAGTIIKGKEVPTTGDNASALIISRGARIFANGTVNSPIIFTSELDDVTDPNDLQPTDRGLWGGLILLGNGVIADDACVKGIEGIPAGESRALYGNCDNPNEAESSGVLRYVSIRHGGAALSEGNEINGLTLGGVGSGTTIEFVEIYANLDDGIEYFGGTVNVKHAVISFCGDDGMDYDTGWRGKGQFWFVLVGDDTGDNGGEHDGAIPDENTPFSNPTIFNATYIGSSVATKAIKLRDAAGGTYGNSIFTKFTNGIEVEEEPSKPIDSWERLQNGEINMLNNIWWDFNDGNTLAAGEIIAISSTATEDSNGDVLRAHLLANENVVQDPGLGGISYSTDGGLNPIPNATGPAFNTSLADYPSDPFFTQVSFKGAFGTSLWIRGWTALDANGHIPAEEEVTIKDDDLVAGQQYTWTNDKVYLLDGFVYLEEGGRLNIQPGTIIKGKEVPTTGDNASALIISRGAQIFAEGTAGAPIIFTSELDDVNDPNDLDPTDRGLWGGLILLGNGVIADDACVKGIEGIPAGESRALYGNCDNPNEAESSGVLRYVSIRHGGAALSEGNEINGLTLGGVGSGTTIEFIEIFANLDDGIEYFGGTVNVKNAVISFCGDDGMDYDTGWRGKGQFWFVLIGDDTGDNGGEHDGAIPDENTPFSNPTIFNATYIGSPVATKAIKLRDAAGGTYGNSIFTKFTNGIEVEEEPTKPIDSWERLQNGEINMLNNIWWDFADGNTLAAGEIIAISSTATEDTNGDVLRAHLLANENVVQDPGLGGISYTTDGGLNPIPDANGPAFNTSLANYPSDPFFTPVSFKGAFCSEGVWINGWTALSETGVLNGTLPSVDGMMCDQVVATNEIIKGDKGYVLGQNRPNPFSNTTQFSFTLPKTMEVSLKIYAVDGREITAVIDNETMNPGEHLVSFNASGLPAGLYYYSLRNEEVVITKRMIVVE